MAIKNPSQLQLNIFEAYKTTKSNICINAGPGASKTSVLLELLSFVRPDKKGIFLAFNNSIVEEAKSKIYYPHIKVSTLHSLGMGALSRRFNGAIKVNEYKNLNLIRKTAESEWLIPIKEIDSYLFKISSLMDIYRLNRCEGEVELIDAATYQDIIFNSKEITHALLGIDILQEYNNEHQQQKQIDFVDMIYLPVTRSDIRMDQFDEVFIDELQDLSLLQQDFIKKIKKPNGRFIAVGDPKQSIYKFMGADIDSFRNFELQPNTITLPLSISYRCPKNVVKAANEIWNVILPFEENEDGEVRSGKKSEIQEGDFVLCRNNQPLVELYFELLANEQKCFIRGKDIGENLIRLIKPFVSLPKDEALLELDGKLQQLTDELLSRGVKRIKDHPRYVALNEKIVVVKMIAEKYNSISEVKSVLERMFSDNGKGIILSSIHKAKGSESNNVFILRRDLIPSKYAKSPSALEQEKNLLYVAYTRAKKKLIFLEN